jgi:hypothetical protein
VALVPLQIQAGIYRNGTDLQSQGRWRDANLIRWTDGTMGPVGGWRVKTETAAANKIRGMLAWKENSGTRRIAAGSYNKLYTYTQAGVQSDITPAGLTAGREDADINTGYGAGAYGDSYYGTERADNASILEATTWSLDSWGEYLVACNADDGKIYEWTLNPAVPAAVVTNAPTGNKAILVTEERFLLALGASGNPRLIKWCDKEDNTSWTPAATNEAGDFELQTAGEIMCGVRVRGQALVLTTIDAHVMSYLGPPYVYSRERVGTSCGIISRKAVAVTDLGAVWMGRKAFYSYSGGAVSKVPSEVSDYVFSDINQSQITKVYATTNARFSEVWWFYPSGGSTENDRYVVWNYAENTWSIGSLARTAAVDHGAFRYPLWASADDNHIYEHEFGFDYGTLTPFAESGPVMLATGDQVASVVQMLPDEKTQGDVSATFKARFYPNGEEREYGPYVMSNPVSLRFTGRQLRIRVEGERLANWRVGINRLDIVAGGRR